MAMTSEFVAAINQIAAERGIDKEEIFLALEAAILVAYKKEKFQDLNLSEEEQEEVGQNLTIELDRETGEFKLIATKEVVEKVSDENTQIADVEAKMISPSVEIGDSIQLEMPVGDFGRIAAQTAKQVILQKMRESEKEAVLVEFNDRVGEVFSALMQRMQKGQVVFEIGKATAIMPQEEQISNEFYRLGERYKVLLKSIDDGQIIVSRADPKFLVELFKLEVPEIESGVVEIKAVAREAGSRSKIAVVSHQDGVDPIGSCVGQRGIRIANVMNEIGEEKIDIIEWDESPEKFVANALSPAKIASVKIEEDTATVTVDEDQLSLAIGREGQNVRLAWKLTGFKIDIVGNGINKPEEKVEVTEDNIVEENVTEEAPAPEAIVTEDVPVAEENVTTEPDTTGEVVEESPVAEEEAPAKEE